MSLYFGTQASGLRILDPIHCEKDTFIHLVFYIVARSTLLVDS